MAREHFYSDERKLRERLLMLKDLVAERELYTHPCPLLATQINELGVLCKMLQADVQKLAECVEKAMRDA